MPTKTCLYCRQEFDADHGNYDYCAGMECGYESKLQRQAREYPIGNDAKKAIQKNHKIFTNLLKDEASGTFELLTILKLGFNQNGYFGFGLHKDSKKQFFIVHDFYFHITSDNPQKIQIWKLSKK